MFIYQDYISSQLINKTNFEKVFKIFIKVIILVDVSIGKAIIIGVKLSKKMQIVLIVIFF